MTVEIPDEAARAMALAANDGCFESLDYAEANRELMSESTFEDEAGAGEEDRDWYRTLARAAAPAILESRVEAVAKALFLERASGLSFPRASEHHWDELPEWKKRAWRNEARDLLGLSDTGEGE